MRSAAHLWTPTTHPIHLQTRNPAHSAAWRPYRCHALAEREAYPLNAVIYAAVVSSAVDSRDYFAPHGEFRSRPDCIYTFHRATGLLKHARKTRLHQDSAHAATDVGRHPYYRNARTLLSTDFRYLGVAAKRIPSRLAHFIEMAKHLGQGHRVFEDGSPVGIEVDAIFRLLWRLPTAFTPVRVEDEAYDHSLRRPMPRRPIAMSVSHELSSLSELKPPRL